MRSHRTAPQCARADANWFSPPPRDAPSQAPIWEGLQQGVFQTFSSDHCPFRWPVMTIARGEMVARDGVIVGKKGAGRILERDISAYAAAGETP